MQDEWVLNKLTLRVLVLSGGAGIGKTGIMSKLVRTRTNSVIAHHFCRHDDSRKRNPKNPPLQFRFFFFLFVFAFLSSIFSMISVKPASK